MPKQAYEIMNPSQKKRPICHFLESLKQIAASIRDLLIPFLPRFLVDFLVGKTDFVFLVHPIDLEDIAKKYPFIASFSKNQQKTFSRFLWPVIGPKILGYRIQGKEVIGRTVFCPLSTRIMLLRQTKAKKKILKAALLSEKIGAKILGLGAFIPIVTDDGVFLRDKISIGLTTGTAYAAIISTKNVLAVSERLGLKKNRISLAIVGAGGSVGSICSKMLVRKFGDALLIDRNQYSLDVLKKDLERLNAGDSIKYRFSNHVNDIVTADIILVATNVPGALIKSRHLKSGAIVVDASFPKNVSKKVLAERKDVLIIDSGIARVKGMDTGFDFQLGIHSRDEVFSCLAEVFMLLWLNRKGKYVGKIEQEYVMELFNNSDKAGIELPPFRNHHGYIQEMDIDSFKKIVGADKVKVAKNV